MTIRDFYRLVKPTISWISDEHAGISLPEKMDPFADSSLLLPVTLKRQGSSYVVDNVLGTVPGISPGMVIRKINNTDLDKLVQVCAGYTTGFPSQRQAKSGKYFGSIGNSCPQMVTYRRLLQQTLPHLPVQLATQ